MNLRRAKPIVRDFCARIGVPYTETGLVHSYRLALTHLHEAGAPLRRARVNLRGLDFSDLVGEPRFLRATKERETDPVEQLPEHDSAERREQPEAQRTETK